MVIKNKIVVSVQVLDLDRLDNKDGTFFFAFKKLVFHIVVNIRKFLSVNYFNFIIIFKKAIKALVFQVIEKAFYLRFEIIGVELFSSLYIPKPEFAISMVRDKDFVIDLFNRVTNILINGSNKA